MNFDIAFLSSGNVATPFALSLTETIRTYPTTSIFYEQSKKIVFQKNFITRYWLNHSTKEWLLWTDADMSWTPQDIQTLTNTAAEPGIFSGLWFHHSHDGHIYPGFFPSRKDDNVYAVMTEHLEFPTDQPFQVEATGGGFMFVHRQVFETLNDPDTDYPFFEVRSAPVTGYSQMFCIRAKDAGFPIVIEPRAQIGHNETIALTREHYNRHWSVK